MNLLIYLITLYKINKFNKHFVITENMSALSLDNDCITGNNKEIITARRQKRKAGRQTRKAKGRAKRDAKIQAEIQAFESKKKEFEAKNQAFETKRTLKEQESNLALQLRLQEGHSRPFDSFVRPDTQKELCAYCKQPQIPWYLGEVHMIGCVSALPAKNVLLAFPNESWRTSTDGFPTGSVWEEPL